MQRVTQCEIKTNVWTHENRISSDSKTEEACLRDLPAGAKELVGKLIRVDGKTKLGGIFSYTPFEPNSKVTTDGFDQTVLYHNLHNVSSTLTELGFDIQKLVRGRRGNQFKITGHANATPQLNAWYSPQNGELTFGTNNGKWHLASDNDVSTHELGHLILDHFSPGLTSSFGKEGGAIHEGFGDALSSLFFNDPEMSEDFSPMNGGPESKTSGLRTVDNNLTLKTAGKEVHDRGRVYGAFFWSIKEILANPEGPFKLTSRDAATLTMKILMNHSANYKTTKPEPKDFVIAVISGLEALHNSGQLNIDGLKLRDFIISEAGRRAMITSPDDIRLPKPEFKSIAEVQLHMAKKGSYVRFKKSHGVDFIGGKFETYDQYLSTKKYGDIPVVGGKILIQKDAQNRLIYLSTKDLLQVKSSQIDENAQISLSHGLYLAQTLAESELKKTQIILNTWGRESANNRQEEIGRIELTKMILENDLRKFRGASGVRIMPSTTKSRIVLLEGSNVPHYEIKTGMSIYYVNMKGGEVTRHNDILIN